MIGTKEVLTLIFLYSFYFVTYGDSSLIFAETLEKCGIKDLECQKKLFETTLVSRASEGVPEFGIPPFEPYEVKSTTVSLLGLLDLSLIDGTVEGVTSCKVTKFKTDIDKGIAESENFCERVTIQGHYKIDAGPLVQSLIGNTVSGEGNGQIQIDKMILTTKIPFSAEKKDDGEIYLVPNAKDAEYTTDVTDKITFKADNVMLGNQEVSTMLTNFMNRNWKMILRSFGRFFSDKVMDIFYYNIKMLFSSLPAKNYIIDDLSSYVKS